MAEPEPVIAEDGVQDVPLTVARPLLTRLIEQLREDDLVSALTVRGRRRAYLINVTTYEQALGCFAAVERLRELCDDPEKAKLLKELDGSLHLLVTSGKP